jgi:hypothetical protein
MSSNADGDDEAQEPVPDAGAPPRPATPGSLLTAEPVPVLSAPPAPPSYWAQRSPAGAAVLLFASVLIPIVFIFFAIRLLRRTYGRARLFIFGVAVGGWAVLGVLGAVYSASLTSANGYPPEAPFYAVGYDTGLRLFRQFHGIDAPAHCTNVADRIGSGSGIPASNWQGERPFFMDGCLDGSQGHANRYPNQPLPQDRQPVN